MWREHTVCSDPLPCTAHVPLPPGPFAFRHLPPPRVFFVSMRNQRRPLLRAALHGDLPRLQQALAAGAPASESASAGGLGPLHAAAASGLAAAVPLLVAAGADVNGGLQDVAACSDLESCGPTLTKRRLIELLRTAGTGTTPLHVAAALGKPAVVQALLDAGGRAMRLGSQCSARSMPAKLCIGMHCWLAVHCFVHLPQLAHHSAGADVDPETDKLHNTPLSILCNHLEMSPDVQQAALALVTAGADCSRPVARHSHITIVNAAHARPVRRAMLLKLHEQLRQQGEQGSEGQAPAGGSQRQLTVAQLRNVLIVAGSDANADTAVFYLQAWYEAAQREHKQLDDVGRFLALAHTFENEDEQVLPALLQAGIASLSEPLPVGFLSDALVQAAEQRRYSSAAALLQHGAEVEARHLSSLLTKACGAAVMAASSAERRAVLQEAEHLLRLLLSHGQPAVPLGTEEERASVYCCPFFAMASELQFQDEVRWGGYLVPPHGRAKLPMLHHGCQPACCIAVASCTVPALPEPPGFCLPCPAAARCAARAAAAGPDAGRGWVPAHSLSVCHTPGGIPRRVV